MTKRSKWLERAVTALAGLGLAGAAQCDDNGDRCDKGERLYRGLCYVIDAGGDAPAVDAAGGAAITPPDLPDTPAPRSGS
ncbi:MAG TPA: hypothetical protein VFP84_02565 [Kofleriaceae bacterium]|nr:hypothetical protein [Kofleriaceae bacterium]